MRMVKILLPIISVLLIGFALTSFYAIEEKCKNLCYDDVLATPKRSVALVLGTNPLLANGQANPFYTHRIEAAVKLYQANKMEYILVSGDNGTNHYDEVSAMRNDLIQKGIPAEKIYRDYAGFRTLDSIVRAKEVFNLNDIIIISQAFHNERALFIAQHKGLNKAIAYNAQDVTFAYGIKTKLREIVARVLAVVDMLIDRNPKFLGQKITIGKDAPN